MQNTDERYQPELYALPYRTEGRYPAVHHSQAVLLQHVVREPRLPVPAHGFGGAGAKAGRRTQPESSGKSTSKRRC